MASQFIQDILDRIEELEGKQPTVDLDRQGIEVATLEQEVRKLNVSKEYRRRIEDLEARWAWFQLNLKAHDKRSKRYDFVVSTDTEILGTHIRLSGVSGAYQAAVRAGGDRAILVLTNETFSRDEVLGEFSDVNITIEGLTKRKTILTAFASASLFSKDANNSSADTGSITFRNITLADNGADLFDINAVFGSLFFENVKFNCADQDVIDISAIAPGTGSIDRFIYAYNCEVTAVNFINLASGGNLEGTVIENCDMTLTGNVLQGPGDFHDVDIHGGMYQCDRFWSTNFTWDHIYVSNVTIEHTGANACFSSDSNSSNQDALILTDIKFMTAVDGSVFCDLQTAGVNPNENLIINNLSAWHRGSDNSGNACVTVDGDDWLEAHIGLIAVFGWVTKYSGPDRSNRHSLLSTVHTDTTAATVLRGSIITGVGATPKWTAVTKGAAGSLFSSNGTDVTWQTDIKLLGYLRVGSASAPTNTTAGDITGTRLIIPNASIISGTRVAQITDTYTPAGSAGIETSMVLRTIADPPQGITTDDIRSLSVETFVRPTATYDGFTTAFYVKVEHDSGAQTLSSSMRGLVLDAVQNVSGQTVSEVEALRVNYRAADGTITTAVGLDILRGQGGDSGAITTGIGLKIRASSAPTPTNDWAIQTLGGQHGFTGNVRIGSLTAPTVALDVTGAVKISTTLAVTGTSSLAGTTVSSTLAVTGATTLSGGIATSTTLTGTLTTTSNVVVKGGGLTLGVVDVTNGLMTLEGQATGGSEGGETRFKTATDHKASIDYWAQDVSSIDLRFFQSTGEIAMRFVGAAGLPTIEFPASTSVPGAATAASVRFRPFTAGGRTMPFWQDPSSYQFVPAEKCLSAFLRPVNEAIGLTTGAPTQTSAFVFQVYLVAPIHVTGFMYNITSGGANADNEMRIAIYTHDGADKIMDHVDTVGTATGTRNMDVTDFWMWPGHYYVFVCQKTGTGAGSTVSLWTSNNIFISGAGLSGADVGGNLTITGGAADATIDPTAITTPGDDKAIVLRLFGD